MFKWCEHLLLDNIQTPNAFLTDLTVRSSVILTHFVAIVLQKHRTCCREKSLKAVKWSTGGKTKLHMSCWIMHLFICEKMRLPESAGSFSLMSSDETRLRIISIPTNDAQRLSVRYAESISFAFSCAFANFVPFANALLSRQLYCTFPSLSKQKAENGWWGLALHWLW